MLKTIKKKVPFEVPQLGMDITIDPLEAFDANPGAIFESLGLIPYFIAESALLAGKGATKDMAEQMLRHYGFGSPYESNMLDQGGSLDSDSGLYSYEGDPDLSPLAKFELKYTTVWVYQYGLVAIDDGETQWMQRFD